MFNIQIVNSCDGILKTIIIYDFKDVSNKYLNKYLIHHNFVNFIKKNRGNKEQILLKYILVRDFISKSSQIFNRQNLSLSVA